MALGPVSFSGLASGLDIKSIIAAILKAERQPIDRLAARQSSNDAKRGAFDGFQSKLAAFRTQLQDLLSPQTLAGRAASSSHDAIVTVTAAPTAELGSHEIEVTALARAHRVRSAAVSGRYDPAVADGTITLRSGNKTAIELNISASAGNNSLASVRDQINAADAGVQASIVNDGTGDILLVRASASGTANALTITDTTNLGLAAPANVLESAANAALTVDRIAITSASNTVAGAIAGVTLDLQSASPGTRVSVTVGANLDQTRKTLRDFVASYNSVAEFFGAQFTVNQATGKAGILAGDALLRQSQDILQSAVSGGVPGLAATDLTTLGALGVVIEGSSGKLVLDEAKLTAVLTDRFDQVARLFGVSGRGSDPSVVLASTTAATRAGSYAVGVTSAAERATLAGSAAIRGAGLAEAETLTIAAGGASTDVGLAKGDSLATIVSKLNAALTTAGIAARASADGGRLRLQTLDYGSAATLEVTSDVADPGDGTTTGIGTDVLRDAGVDIVGSIGGAAATGVGNVLTGAAGSDFEGLSLAVFADAALVTARNGDFGTFVVTRGVADRLARDLKSIVDPVGGLVSTTIARYDDDNRRLRDQIAQLELRLKDRELFLTLQFDAAERAIQALQQQQSALGGNGSR